MALSVTMPPAFSAACRRSSDMLCYYLLKVVDVKEKGIVNIGTTRDEYLVAVRYR